MQPDDESEGAYQSSPERNVSITRDDTRLKPRGGTFIGGNIGIMDEECRKEMPPNLVVGGMNVDMMDMDMN